MTPRDNDERYSVCEGCEDVKFFDSGSRGASVDGDWYCDECVLGEDYILRCRACGTWRKHSALTDEDTAARCCDGVCAAKRVVGLECVARDVERLLSGNIPPRLPTMYAIGATREEAIKKLGEALR